MKKLLIILAVASMQANGDPESTFCVDKTLDNAEFIAKATGDAYFVSNTAETKVQQVSTNEVKLSGSNETNSYSYRMNATQEGRVYSEIVDKWIIKDQLCVELAFRSEQ